MLSQLLTAAGLIVAAIGTWVTARTNSQSARAAAFLKNYRRLREHEPVINAEVLSRSPIEWRAHPIPMLTKKAWIAEEPWPLDSVELAWESGQPDPPVDDLVERSRILRRLKPGGAIAYSRALIDIADLKHLFNGTIYRPIAIDFTDSSRSLTFSEASYFDYLDTSEILAFQAALPEKDFVRRRLRGRYRRRLADPFMLSNRVASLGVLTLTVRASAEAGESTFFLHKRDPARVALGAELFHVIPAGEFTPSDVSAEALRTDFALWRNIAREYAEEFLGMEAAQGRGGREIGFDSESPFRELAQARTNGGLTVSILGIALDPLTWKPEILTVAVFHANTFDAIFSQMVVRNDEGVLVTRRGVGLPFDENTIHSYTHDRATRAGAKACLALAWQQRVNLGIARS